MKKPSIFIILIIAMMFVIPVFSQETAIDLYINEILLETSSPVINDQNSIMVPFIETFETLGAKVNTGNILSTYYLNTFVKVDAENNFFSINGKVYKYDKFKTRNNQLYVPLELLTLAFDLTTDTTSDTAIYLKANRIISYRSYNNIPYRSVDFENEGAGFSIPLDWYELNTNIYGYDSNYGRIGVNLSIMTLNENIDLDYIMDTYKEHLVLTLEDGVTFNKSDQKIYNYLTSNVLYIDKIVNGILTKEVVHFVEAGNNVYLLEFSYPIGISESYILQVFENIMNTFYINEYSFDKHAEHYLEFKAARDFSLTLSSEAYANMTVDNTFNLEGYFNTDKNIDSLSITIKKDDEKLSYYVPVENNSFNATVYVPFGLGKHDVQIAISPEEEKIIFDPNHPHQLKAEQPLLTFSVVNLSKKSNRYTIPTKKVQSDHKSLSTMSKLVTRNYQTTYARAKAIYDYIVEDIEVLTINDINFTALEVNEQFRGTKVEILYYMTALLRAQDIPTRIIEGKGMFSNHYWLEAQINNKWLIIDPFGYYTIDVIESDEIESIFPGFNVSPSPYKLLFQDIKALDD